MTDLIDVVQLQETDDALVELFDITLPTGTTVYVFSGLDEGSDNVYFPNKAGTVLNEYIALPIKLDGVEVRSAGNSNRPNLTVANIPALTRAYQNNGDGTNDEDTLLEILTDQGFLKNEDFLTSRVTIRRTMLSHTKRAGDSPALPVEFPTLTYIIDRVASENSLIVSFELTSPIDAEGLMIPNRMIIGKYCPWRYQGHSLNYDGGCYWPLNSNGRFFDVEDNLITKDYTVDFSEWNNTSTYTAGDKLYTTTNSHVQIWEAKVDVPANKNPETQNSYWKRIDLCGKTLNSCKIRFQGNNINTDLTTSVPLPFGGFPGSKKFR